MRIAATTLEQCVECQHEISVILTVEEDIAEGLTAEIGDAGIDKNLCQPVVPLALLEIAIRGVVENHCAVAARRHTSDEGGGRLEGLAREVGAVLDQNQPGPQCAELVRLQNVEI